MKNNLVVLVGMLLILSNVVLIIPSEKVNADSYDGEDLALALLSNSSWLVDCSYSDTDYHGNRMAAVLDQLGTMHPTHGSDFAFLSTGKAGVDIITTDEDEPGDERGEWFHGGSHGSPRDRATLTLTLQVPLYMHYLYYDVQFLSAEYPEYVGTQYNDKFRVTVDSPSEGESSYSFDVNSGYFLLDSRGIPGTGFDIFATSGYPSGPDWVDTTYRRNAADAGASGLIQIGGLTHPVSPNEQITVEFDIRDAGDNLFDSGAFIDNFKFTGYAKTDITARKTIENLDSELIDTAEAGDIIRYRILISNTGAADQDNNPGYEFEDIIPENLTIVDLGDPTSGTLDYLDGQRKIVWDGEIPGESSVIFTFDAEIAEGLDNGTIISNQGTVNWDSNEDGTNDATELTDYPYPNIYELIDSDGDDETDDDDPTDLTIYEFEYPSSVTEGFADDDTGSSANQSYMDREWFYTSLNTIVGSDFEVAGGYYYETAKSFKTKMRQSAGTMYWYYNLSELDGDLNWWEAQFACGDGCDDADLYLDFKNSNGQDIARLKFEYIQLGDTPPCDWLLQLSYYNPIGGWTPLLSDYVNGYLRNSWYNIRIEKNGENHINYILNRTGIGMVDSETSDILAAAFQDFDRVEFYSTKNPIICPMIFWDEHTIGLT